MLYWAVVFLIITLVAGMFGFEGVGGSAAGVGKVLFTVFLIASVVTGIMSQWLAERK